MTYLPRHFTRKLMSVLVSLMVDTSIMRLVIWLFKIGLGSEKQHIVLVNNQINNV